MPELRAYQDPRRFSHRYIFESLQSRAGQLVTDPHSHTHCLPSPPGGDQDIIAQPFCHRTRQVSESMLEQVTDRPSQCRLPFRDHEERLQEASSRHIVQVAQLGVMGLSGASFDPEVCQGPEGQSRVQRDVAAILRDSTWGQNSLFDLDASAGRNVDGIHGEIEHLQLGEIYAPPGFEPFAELLGDRAHGACEEDRVSKGFPKCTLYVPGGGTSYVDLRDQIAQCRRSLAKALILPGSEGLLTAHDLKPSKHQQPLAPSEGSGIIGARLSPEFPRPARVLAWVEKLLAFLLQGRLREISRHQKIQAVRGVSRCPTYAHQGLQLSLRRLVWWHPGHAVRLPFRAPGPKSVQSKGCTSADTLPTEDSFSHAHVLREGG